MSRFAKPPPSSTTADERVGIEPPADRGPVLPLATIALIRPSRTAAAVEVKAVTGADVVLRLARSGRVVG